jgi:hypothetical protein
MLYTKRLKIYNDIIFEFIVIWYINLYNRIAASDERYISLLLPIVYDVLLHACIYLCISFKFVSIASILLCN